MPEEKEPAEMVLALPAFRFAQCGSTEHVPALGIEGSLRELQESKELIGLAICVT